MVRRGVHGWILHNRINFYNVKYARGRGLGNPTEGLPTDWRVTRFESPIENEKSR